MCTVYNLLTTVYYIKPHCCDSMSFEGFAKYSVMLWKDYTLF